MEKRLSINEEIVNCKIKLVPRPDQQTSSLRIKQMYHAL